MKLKKAPIKTPNYPKRENFKPIMLSVTVAMALTACTPHTAGKMPNKNSENNCTSTPNQVREEIKTPENIAGGMPVYIPDQNRTWGQKPQK